MKVLNDWKLLLLASLTLGLAPFFPEPHLFGKIKWVLGGGIGMKPLDWLDMAWHGLPWLLLLRIGILKLIKIIKERKESNIHPKDTVGTDR